MRRPKAFEAAKQMSNAVPKLSQSTTVYAGEGSDAYIWLKKTSEQQEVESMCIAFDKDLQLSTAGPTLGAFAELAGLTIPQLESLLAVANERFTSDPDRVAYRERGIGGSITVPHFPRNISVRVDYT